MTKMRSFMCRKLHFSHGCVVAACLLMVYVGGMLQFSSSYYMDTTLQATTEEKPDYEQPRVFESESGNARDGEHSDGDGDGSRPHYDYTMFHRQPTQFMDEFVDCMRDEECQIFYHHVQKASGTYVASRLYGYLNNHKFRKDHGRGRKNDSTSTTTADVTFDGAKWCCHDELMERLRHRPEDRCRLKFSTWEVTSYQFLEVLDMCFFDEQHKNKHTNKHTHNYTRMVVLEPYRDPLERTLSMIGNFCNEPRMDELRMEQLFIKQENPFYLNFTTGSTMAAQQVVDACHHCNYSYTNKNNITTTISTNIAAGEDESSSSTATAATQKTSSLFYNNDAEIWNHFILLTNDLMKGVYDIVQHVHVQHHGNNHTRTMATTPATSTASTSKQAVAATTLLLDVANTTAFFERLQAAFPDQLIPKGEPNAKVPFRNCKFDLMDESNAGFVNGLLPATNLYHNLTSN
jgi:hypothetical protein